MSTFDILFFIVLPYVALFIFLIGSILRYKYVPFKYSSLSSEFLENKRLFWGSIPFHVGIVMIFLGHLMVFLLPKEILSWNSIPVRLLILEVGAFMLGLSTLFGLIMLIIRRITNSRLRIVTSRMDFLVEFLLLAQIILGLWIAYDYRWGSSWFASVLSPYLISIFTFQPDIQAVSQLPLIIRLHIIGAYTIVLLIPFSRLVHFLVPPFSYIWRPYQKVIWYRSKDRVRNPEEDWGVTKPMNN
ncbi:MAG: respiratory nitrate reductase subunit gamma [Ignavibacteria bacterium]|nr:respiratory nitrate reductase subunit gamma [Ignavibacteria bacterium]